MQHATSHACLPRFDSLLQSPTKIAKSEIGALWVWIRVLSFRLFGFSAFQLQFLHCGPRYTWPNRTYAKPKIYRATFHFILFCFTCFCFFLSKSGFALWPQSQLDISKRPQFAELLGFAYSYPAGECVTGMPD